MAFDATMVIKDIETVLAEFADFDNSCRQPARDLQGRPRGNGLTVIEASTSRIAEMVTRLEATHRRYAPYPDYGESRLSQGGRSTERMRNLEGVLKSLADDYRTGRIRPLLERIHSDLFANFLEMAEYLIEDEGLKDPAAILAGGVLEQHIRKLCDKASVATTYMAGKGDIRPKKLSAMNADLPKAGVYGKNEQQQVTAWAGIRNDAAHAHYDRYNIQQIKLMIQGIRDFLQRYPA